MPALCLAAWVAMPGRGALAPLVGAGLVVSAAGDLLLELPGLFLPGLLLFLAAHLCYTAAFVRDTRRARLARALPFAAWGLGVYAFLRPGLGGLSLPVALYMAAICVMMWRAAARVGSGAGPRAGHWWGLAGAVLFGLSDTLIALDRFHAPLPGARYPIILLYWGGQWGIARAARGHGPRPGSEPAVRYDRPAAVG